MKEQNGGQKVCITGEGRMRLGRGVRKKGELSKKNGIKWREKGVVQRGITTKRSDVGKWGNQGRKEGKVDKEHIKLKGDWLKRLGGQRKSRGERVEEKKRDPEYKGKRLVRKNLGDSSRGSTNTKKRSRGGRKGKEPCQ